MKTITATGEFVVSFNCSFGGIDCGESNRYTVDYAGDDVSSLAREVIDDDPNFPMDFITKAQAAEMLGPHDEDNWAVSLPDFVVGVFVEKGNELTWPVAIMVSSKYF